MGKMLLVWGLVGLLVGRASAQCCGDCNGNGVVTIDELVTAVNIALGSCAEATDTPVPTATPTPSNRCPFTFSDNGNLCAFNGTFNRGCGAALDSLVSINGSQLIVTIDTMLDNPPVVQFAADVTTSTTASLTLWSTDNFQSSLHPTSGAVQLNDNGHTLVIFPDDPPFMIQSCNFVQYIGTFTGSARARVVAEQAGAEAFARLRAWRARPVPDLA